MFAMSFISYLFIFFVSEFYPHNPGCMRISRKTLVAWFKAHQTPQAVKDSVREKELKKKIERRESGKDISVKPVERRSRKNFEKIKT